MNKIAKNAFWIVGSRATKMVLSFVISLASARYLGPSNYGVISYASSLVVFVTPLMTLGLYDVLVPELTRDMDREGEILGTTLFACICSSIFWSIFIVLFTIIVNPGERVTHIVCMLFSLNLIFQAVGLFDYWFQAKLLSKYTALVSLFAYTCVSLYKLYLLANGKNVYWFASSYMLENFLTGVLLLLGYRRFGGRKLVFSFKRLRELFEKSRYCMVSGLMLTIYNQTDRIMLKIIAGDEKEGYYAAALVCAELGNFVLAAILDSFRPVIYDCKFHNNPEGFHLEIKRLYSIIIYFSLVKGVMIAVLARCIMYFTYGAAYAPAIPALEILAWHTILSFLSPVRDIWILAENKQRYLAPINLFGATLNIILNSLLIPPFGIVGASIATVASMFITNVMLGFIIPSIRNSAYLMLKSLNPVYLIDMVKTIRRRV